MQKQYVTQANDRADCPLGKKEDARLLPQAALGETDVCVTVHNCW